MSLDTKADLERAIEAHLASEHDDGAAILTGYIVQAVGQGMSDERDLLMYTGKTGQSSVTTLGLLAHIEANVEEIVWGDHDE